MAAPWHRTRCSPRADGGLKNQAGVRHMQALPDTRAGARNRLSRAGVRMTDAIDPQVAKKSAQQIAQKIAQQIAQKIAQELGVRDAQVAAAVELLDGGATVPFIARYRKEATGALDDAQLRTLDERLRYLRELEERRTVILNSIREQGKLDDALEAAIRAADSKGRLEDIYLPFKPKRRTKAEIAKAAGLEPLADLLLGHPENDPV